MNSRSIRATVLGILLTATGVARGDGFERIAPANAWFFAGCDDVKAFLESAKQSEFAAMLLDPALEKARAQFQAVIDKANAESIAETGVDSVALFGMFEGPAAVVTYDPTARDPALRFSDFDLPPTAVLLGAGDRAAEVVAKFEEFSAKDIASGASLRETREVEGVTLTVLTDKPDADSPVIVSFGAVGGTVFFMVGDVEATTAFTAEVDGLVHALLAGADAPLSESPAWRASVAAAERNGVRLFANVGAIMKAMLAEADAAPEPAADQAGASDLDEEMEDDFDDEDEGGGIDGDDEGMDDEDMDELDELEDDLDDSDSPMTKDEAAQIRAMGLDRIGRLAIFLTIGEAGTEVDGELTLEGDTAIGTFLGKLCPTGPFRLHGNAPPTVHNATLTHLDLLAGFDALGDLLTAIDPESAAEFRAGIESAKADGFDIRASILEPLGDEFAFLLSPVTDDMQALPGTEDDPQNITVIVELDGAPALEATIDKFMDEQGLMSVRRKEEFAGTMLYTVPTPLGLEVNYSILPDRLIVSPSRELVLDALRRSGQHELPTLASDPAIAEGLEAIGATNPTILFMVNAAKNARTFLDGVNEGLLMSNPELAAEMPDVSVEDLSRHITGFVLSSTEMGPSGIRGRLRTVRAAK